jgi:hypothetical protein
MQSEESMRRKRRQRGSLQRVKQGSRFMWVVKYYDNDGRRRQTTLGQAARMTKAEAQVERERFMATINEDAAERLARRDPPMLGEFIVGTYLPFKRRRWKLSTAVTTEDRIRRHIVNEIGDQSIDKLDRMLFRSCSTARPSRSVRASSIISASICGPSLRWPSKTGSSTATPRARSSRRGGRIKTQVAP